MWCRLYNSMQYFGAALFLGTYNNSGQVGRNPVRKVFSVWVPRLRVRIQQYKYVPFTTPQ